MLLLGMLSLALKITSLSDGRLNCSMHVLSPYDKGNNTGVRRVEFKPSFVLIIIMAASVLDLFCMLY